MNDDPIGAIARGTARQLAGEYGVRLEVDVEAALHVRGSRRGPETYDPVALASLIVAIATLAWTIYSDLQKESPNAAPDVMKRTMRQKLRRQVDVTPESTRISEIIVTEIVENTRQSDR